MSIRKEKVKILDEIVDEIVCEHGLFICEEESEEIIEDEDEITEKPSDVEEILFRLPQVKEPLIGTPKQVQKKLDKMAIYIRRNPDDHYKNQLLFETIHLYMHGFLINIALKQFPYIKGLQTVDIYQESLIALRFKAIPGFRMRKGMSFLNFAKMCIRRHLITILNSSKTRLKDQSMNRAVSLDSATNQNSDDGATFANTIPDGSDPVDKQTEMNEAYSVTLSNLCKTLSIFEQQVLHEYLTSSSYNEIADDLSRKNKKANPTKSVDNALVRIRNKAQKLMESSKVEDIPLFQL
jgi:RNA polymerase sporulation-specific sigma factor